MESEPLRDPGTRLAQLEKALASATEQVAILRQELGGGEGMGERIGLEACLTTLEAMGILGTSEEADDLLDTIVAVATRTVHAEAGSLLLVTDDQEHLVFEAVHGEKAGELKKFKLKLGQGIAGFVAASGQPLCVTDVGKSEQWDKSISEAIQFQTRSILAVPALAGRRTMGVLEVVNKTDGRGFEQQDIELLSQFAKIAGAAVERRAITSLTASMLAGLKDQAEKGADAQEGAGPTAAMSPTAARLSETLKRLRASETHKQALLLAAEIESICAKGPQAAELCRATLAAVSAYLSKQQGMFGVGQSSGGLTW